MKRYGKAPNVQTPPEEHFNMESPLAIWWTMERGAQRGYHKVSPGLTKRCRVPDNARSDASSKRAVRTQPHATHIIRS